MKTYFNFEEAQDLKLTQACPGHCLLHTGHCVKITLHEPKSTTMVLGTVVLDTMVLVCGQTLLTMVLESGHYGTGVYGTVLHQHVKMPACEPKTCLKQPPSM